MKCPVGAVDGEELPGQRKRSITSGLRRRIRLLPPMIYGQEQVDELLNALEDVLGA